MKLWTYLFFTSVVYIYVIKSEGLEGLRHFNYDTDDVKPKLKSRQVNCFSPCSPLESALACLTAACVCPLLNATSPMDITTCTSCLGSYNPSYASDINLLVATCAHCPDQCSSVITVIIEAYECGSNSTCTCSALDQPGSAAYSRCASCAQPFDSMSIIPTLSMELGQCTGSSTSTLSSRSSPSLPTSSATSLMIPTSSSIPATATSTTAKSSGIQGFGPDLLSIFVLITLLEIFIGVII
jgi:hypothetical protein